MQTLTLTSPWTKGIGVRMAQTVLKRGNIFKADYLDDKVDGTFGPATARACRRARYWLGFSEASLHDTYTPELHDYLTGAKRRGLLMRRRRARRLKALKRKPLGEKALEQARSQLGIKESPAGSNHVKFSAWYGFVSPWCAMFVTWAYVQAGSKAFVKGQRWAYCPYVVADAHAGRNGLQVVSYAKARPGDVVLYDWDFDHVADHIGLLEHKVDARTFDAIEGNTSVGNDSNGGEVMRRRRSLSDVVVFVRVGR